MHHFACFLISIISFIITQSDTSGIHLTDDKNALENPVIANIIKGETLAPKLPQNVYK